MSTKKLAKELGLLRQRSQSSNGLKKSLVSNQMFSYLIVIDFESTCWREKNNHSQEIIEFPAVLLNTSTGEVESEFHTYVQPQEHPVLSEFCTELTGITQMQVEAGIPLHICLSRFSRWLQNLQLNMGVVFPNAQQISSAPSASQKPCTFLTWSDWDLGVCLQYECKRKQLHKPDVLNSWIDLRSTYKLFYDRKPKGLNGALQDLGIQFSGREHSGLDDARNTAHLAARMMRDGCVMKITRSLVRTPLLLKPTFGNTTADNRRENSNTNKKENTLATNKPSSSKIPPKSCWIKSCSELSTKDLNTKENRSAQESVQSLISPKTLLNDDTTPLWRRSVTTEAVNISSLVMAHSTTPHNNNNHNSFVLCSTTMGCLLNKPQLNQPLKTGATVELVKDEGVELLLETDDRCGSYDDVVLEGDDELDVDCVSDLWGEPDTHSSGSQVTSRDVTRETMSTKNNVECQKISKSSTASLSSKKINVSDHQNEVWVHSTISESSTYVAGSRTVTETGLKTSLQAQEKSKAVQSTKTQYPFRHKLFMPENTSTPNSSFAKPKAIVTQHPNHKETPKSSFAIFTDPAKPSCPSSGGSFCAPKNVLSSLSTNTLSLRTNCSSISGAMKGRQRITSPLCACGRRAKRQLVSNGGPNHGRGFFCCPVRRSGSGGSVQKGCEFFKWESAVMKSSSVASPAVRSSVSLCQSSSTNCRPRQRSMIRKSY